MAYDTNDHSGKPAAAILFRARNLFSIFFLFVICMPPILSANDEEMECDASYGEMLFGENQCAGCHTYIAGDLTKSGPNLHGLFGRKAAGIVFPHEFSEALKQSEIVWNAETLDAFIRNPAKLVPGTKMTFLGMDDSQDRADLICFLKEATRSRQTNER